MKRKLIARGIQSFSFSVVMGQLIMLLLRIIIGGSFTGMVPSFRAFFDSDVTAITVGYLLIGLIGAAFGMASFIFELERWSWIKQAVVHFIVTAVVWIPISIFLWGLYKYPQAIISTIIGMSINYVIIWAIRYCVVLHSVSEINKKINQNEEK